MWGMIIAVVVYGIAIGFNIGREGMRQNRTKTEWTMEEIERIKGSAVMGWKMLIVMLLLAGGALTAYNYFWETDKNLSFWWTQISCALFAAAVLSVGILFYAKKNPTVYRIICIMKPEKEIRPTVAQRVESGMKGIWEENFPERKPDMTDLTKAYYEAKEESEHPTAQDLISQYEKTNRGDAEKTEPQKTVQIEQKSEAKDEVDYQMKYMELLEKYTDLLEKYNDLKQDN